MGAVSTYYGSLLPSPVYPLSCCLKDLPVEHEDYKERDVECGAGGKNLVRHVLAYQTPLLEVDAVQVIRILPAKLWCQRDDQSDQPHHHNHDANPRAVSRMDVIDVCHGPVPETKYGE